MKVQVRFFAAARELAGVGQCEIELPDRATVALLANNLSAQHLGMGELIQRYAVNRQFVASDHVLHEGDEVACIPPVGGG
jgi:molybdopterin synthase sulfur carrier subunit